MDVERRSIDELVGLIVGEPVDLVARLGGLAPLSRADPFEIAAQLRASASGRSVPSRRPALESAQTLAAAFELGRRVSIEQAVPAKLASPDAVASWARPRLATLAHEELWMLALDGRGHLRAARLLARGGLHGAAVQTADPLRAVLRVDASAFVIVHNHPSGDPTPSREDLVFTEKLANAASIAGLTLLDHVIVARDDFACVPLP